MLPLRLLLALAGILVVQARIGFGEPRSQPPFAPSPTDVGLKSGPVQRVQQTPDFKQPPQPPYVFKATAESIRADGRQWMKEMKAKYDDVVANVQPENATFANVLEPILVRDNSSAPSEHLLGFYLTVSADAAIRAASSEFRQLLSSFQLEMHSRKDYAALVEAVHDSARNQSLEAEQLRILRSHHQQLLLRGLGRPNNQRVVEAGTKKLHNLASIGNVSNNATEMEKELKDLSLKANRNLVENNGSIWFTREELEGVPKRELKWDELEKGSGENEGKLRLTFEPSHAHSIMTHAVNETTRLEYYIAFNNKDDINAPLFHRLAVLRDAKARQAGHSNHASMRTAGMMAKTPDAVKDFLGDLRNRLQDEGARELAPILENKKRHYEKRNASFDGNLFAWDIGFYSHGDRGGEDEEPVKDEVEMDAVETAVSVSDYFPMDTTMERMLGLVGKLFGLVFVELQAEDLARLSATGKAEDLAWHQDVTTYAVWDDEEAGHGFIGYLYLDLYLRDHKPGGAFNFNLVPGFSRSDGSRNYPSTVVVSSLSKPPSPRPMLLSHSEMVMVFHELGHAMHDLLSRTKYACLHGTQVAVDFVEAPSQMLENWTWLPGVIKSLSRHWQTDESMPDSTVDGLVASRKSMKAHNTLGMLHYSLFDMEMHSPKTHEDARKLDLSKLWNGLRRNVTGIKGPEELGLGSDWGHKYASLGHLVGGYDAAYYSYLWSLVYSADMYHSVFEKDPMNGDEGRRYRRTVLEKGGSMDEMEMLEEFLGRKPNSEAFYKQLGLAE
ncbi:hypothetical protein XA68_16922 [Ophiocordyceps unilateralis]|uniref:Peptidase M3A/M3B catalytic domain-containing protein n=1 Tax=Ophiocordyceps unilateralis TaxID=268505 RepID=A0A2A9P424_OPHUN|nr:hypothetical protein XA68_16922 [Ophiocordyceps unilateralis]